jgi:hypothetical protein
VTNYNRPSVDFSLLKILRKLRNFIVLIYQESVSFFQKLINYLGRHVCVKATKVLGYSDELTIGLMLVPKETSTSTTMVNCYHGQLS